MARPEKNPKLHSCMDVSFAVVNGSYSQDTVMHLLVPEMNVVGLVETAVAFIL